MRVVKGREDGIVRQVLLIDDVAAARWHWSIGSCRIWLTRGTARTRCVPTATTCGRYRLLHVPARLTHGGLGVDCDCRDVALGNRDRGGVREHRRDPHPADPTISTQPSRTLENRHRHSQRSPGPMIGLIGRRQERAIWDCPQAPPVTGRPRRLRRPWPLAVR